VEGGGCGCELFLEERLVELAFELGGGRGGVSGMLIAYDTEMNCARA